MDYIFVNRLEINTILGAYEWEREAKQKVLIDLEIHFDSTKAATSDLLQDTIDYGAIVEKIHQLAGSSQFYLAETLAAQIADICLEDERAHSTTVKVTKPTVIPGTAGVGVKISRHSNK